MILRLLKEHKSAHISAFYTHLASKIVISRSVMDLNLAE